MSQNKGSKSYKAVIQVCPECAKAFYSLDKHDATCTFCGFHFIDKRARERVRTSIGFLMKMTGRTLRAEIEDYSRTGIRLAYKGSPLDIDSIIDLDISELAMKVKARAVWTRNAGQDFFRTGFRFIREREGFYAQ